MVNDFHSIAQRALELDKLAPAVTHDPTKCEVCAEYQEEYLAFARSALPDLARGYLETCELAAAQVLQRTTAQRQFLRELHAESDALQRELDARVAEIEELKRGSAVGAAGSETLHRELTDRINALQQELENRAAAAESLRRALEERNTRIEHLRRDYVASQGEIEALQRKLEARTSMVEGLQQELNDRASILETRKRDLEAGAEWLEELNRRARAREAESEALKRDLDASLWTVAELEKDLGQHPVASDAEAEELRRELDARTTRSEELEAELLRTSSERETSRQELESRAAKIEELQRELNALRATVQALLQGAGVRDAEAQALQGKLDVSSLRIAGLEDELQRSLAAREAEADRLQQELDRRAEKIEELQTELLQGSKARETERVTLQEQLAASTSLASRLRDEVNTLNARIVERSEELEAELLRTSSERETSRQELESRAARIEELQRELNALTATVQALLQGAGVRDAEAQALQGKLDVSSLRIAGLEDELQRSLAAREAEADRLQQELDRRAEKIEEPQAELLQGSKARETERVTLQEQLAASTSLASRLRDEVHTLNAEVEDLTENLKSSSATEPVAATPLEELDGQSSDTETLEWELHPSSAGVEASEGDSDADASQFDGLRSEPVPEHSKREVIITPSRSQSRITQYRGPVAMADPGLTFAQAAGHESDNLSFRQLLLTSRRHRWVVLGVTLATVAAAAGYNRLAEPVYQSSATIRIDDKDPGSSLFPGVAAIPGLISGKIQTEIEVLRSRRLAENAAKKLHMNLDVQKPSNARSLMRIVEMPVNVAPAKVTLTRKDVNSYSIRQEDGPATSFPREVTVGAPFSIGRSTFVLDRPSTGSLPSEISFRIRPLRRAVDDLREDLTVSRPHREAQIVNVRYKSSDPFLAAAVPNLILDEFIRDKAQTSRTEATSMVGFLRQQVASYERQLKGAESALGGFRQQARVVSIADEAQAQVRRMADMQAERDQVRSERQALASILAKMPSDAETTARDIAAFPSFITNRAMQDILQSLIELENQRSQLLLRRNPENADVVAVTKRIADLKRQLTQMGSAYLAGLDSKLASLDVSVRSFGRQIETIPAKEIEYARLSREQKLVEDISTLLQTRLKEAEIREAIQPGDVRGIDRALIPDRPTSPKQTRNILFGILGGLFLGCAAAVAREMLNTRVRTKEDLQGVTGGIPVLGAIPTIPRMPKNGRVKGRDAKARGASEESGNALMTRVNSSEVFAEAYRALRTNITFAAADHANQVLVVTSALAGDGKSVTASNLAVTLAQQGARTLLVDADLRKGMLHEMFRVRREPGLTQLLIGDGDAASAVRGIPLGENGQFLSLLTSGRRPPNPAELLGSERMRALLEQLRQQFDTIILDAPPLTLVTDAAVLGTLADSTILVARAGVTDKRALQHAAAQLYHLRVHVSGTIMNDFNPNQPGYGYDYGYGYAPGYGNEYAYGQPK